MNTPAASTAGIECIVIGASAGGVQAISSLLPALSRRLQAAVLIVLHIPRERPSMLTLVFGPRCSLPVVEAEDKLPIESGTVYVAPPDYHLLVDRGPAIALSADALVNFSRPSIDVLFESAADLYGPGLMGIVMSGANSDGAAGLAAVHRGGGVCIVQHPEEAEVATMPESALKKVPTAQVLRSGEIATLLAALAGPQ